MLHLIYTPLYVSLCECVWVHVNMCACTHICTYMCVGARGICKYKCAYLCMYVPVLVSVGLVHTRVQGCACIVARWSRRHWSPCHPFLWWLLPCSLLVPLYLEVPLGIFLVHLFLFQIIAPLSQMIPPTAVLLESSGPWAHSCPLVGFSSWPPVSRFFPTGLSLE